MKVKDMKALINGLDDEREIHFIDDDNEKVEVDFIGEFVKNKTCETSLLRKDKHKVLLKQNNYWKQFDETNPLFCIKIKPNWQECTDCQDASY